MAQLLTHCVAVMRVLSSQGLWIASFVLPQNKAFSPKIAAFIGEKQNICFCEYIRFILFISDSVLCTNFIVFF